MFSQVLLKNDASQNIDPTLAPLFLVGGGGGDGERPPRIFRTIFVEANFLRRMWIKQILRSWGRHSLNISFLKVIKKFFIKPQKRVFLTFPSIFRVKKQQRLTLLKNFLNNTHLSFMFSFFVWEKVNLDVRVAGPAQVHRNKVLG